MPDTQHDERTTATIEAFIEGPAGKPGRRSANGTGPALTGEAGEATTSPVRPRRPFVLDTRADWLTAVRHEDARHARYGRPVSVLRIELAGDAMGPAIDRAARTAADCVRANARETDRAARLSTGSLRLLLPETGGRAARVVAERIEQAYSVVAGSRIEAVTLRVEVVTPTRTGSLEEALAAADRAPTAADRASGGRQPRPAAESKPPSEAAPAQAAPAEPPPAETPPAETPPGTGPTPPGSSRSAPRSADRNGSD